MVALPPKLAAELAEDIYAVQKPIELQLFLARSEFSQSAGKSARLEAEVGTRLISTRDSFGVCACGGTGYENDIFLIFRGSTTANYGADWLNNGRIGIETSKTGLPVHIGFNHIFCSMLPQIQSFITSQRRPIGTVHCIGHSLGGAVATLAADWVKSHTSSNVKIYTFGAPKPGVERFAARLTSKVTAANIHRVYHTSDPVPMVPVYPFTHTPMPGAGYAIPTGGMVSFAAHSIGQYVKSVSDHSWCSLRGPMVLQNQDRQVECWLVSDGPVNPANPTTWDWINAGLTWVLKKVLKDAASVLQAPFVATLSLADKIAWLLRQGIDLARECGIWVLRLMRKIMQAVGMAVAKTVEELTQAFMRMILQRLMARITEEAKRAIRHILQR